MKGVLKIYDLQGRVVKDLSSFLKPGEHLISIKDRMPSGVYFIRFKAKDYRKILKVVRVK